MPVTCPPLWLCLWLLWTPLSPTRPRGPDLPSASWVRGCVPCTRSNVQPLSEYHVLALNTFEGISSAVDGRLAVFGNAYITEYSVGNGVRNSVSVAVSRWGAAPLKMHVLTPSAP